MKRLNFMAGAILAGASAVAMAAPAQTSPADNATQQADISQQLEQAQQALQAAAARIAALSLETFSQQFHRGLWQMNMSLGWARLGVNLGEPGHGGLTVQAVTPGGAADQAGIQAGDTLQSVAGISLSGHEQHQQKLADTLDGLDPGEQVSVSWLHGGKPHHAKLTAQDLFASVHKWAEREGALAEQQAAAARAAFAGIHTPHPIVWFEQPDRWGDMELAKLTPQLGRYFGTSKGLLVVRAPDDDALKLKDGDVILKIGTREPGSPTQAMRILRSYTPGDTLKLTVMRDRHQQAWTVKLPQDD
ncbi:MAG TPA: PDZ domain-containing protein [Gammaproteobacteria bacterium]|nr:PDZ domain-containing protein [Gammaproteobacteria bacterium]